MTKLAINVDHVATLRQARGITEPDPVIAAGFVPAADHHARLVVGSGGRRREQQDCCQQEMEEEGHERLLPSNDGAGSGATRTPASGPGEYQTAAHPHSTLAPADGRGVALGDPVRERTQ